MSSDALLGRPMKESPRMCSPDDLLPDIRDVVIAVQKIQQSNRAACSIQKEGKLTRDFDFLWRQGAINNKCFVTTFTEKLAGNTMQKFWHKQRLISTLQAVEHVYADTLDMNSPVEVFTKFEYFHAWLAPRHNLSNESCPVEVTVIAKLLNSLAWMCISSVATLEDPNVVGMGWHERLTYPPEGIMKGQDLVSMEIAFDELEKKGLDRTTKLPNGPRPFDPIDISPDWFTLEYPIDVYVRWWISSPNVGHNFYIDRLMGEFKFFLTMIIARLKNDIDIVSTMQTKILGTMATVAFASISHAARRLQSDENLD